MFPSSHGTVGVGNLSFFGTGLPEELGNLRIACLRGNRQSCGTIAVLETEVRTSRQQGAHDSRMAFISCHHEGRPATVMLRIDLSATVEQELDSGSMTVHRCHHQKRKTGLVFLLEVCPTVQQDR